MFDSNEIEKIINYKFNNKQILKRAFTHSSYSKDSNERLEFLGDSVLQIIISTYLFNESSYNEGVLSKYRAKIVCEKNLYDAIENLKLKKYLIVGDSYKEEPTKAMCADLCEAIIGAIYYDSGNLDEAKRFIFGNINLDMELIDDYKSKLQEYVQGLVKSTQDIEYTTFENGVVDGAITFCSKLYISKSFYGEGIGNTKKEAEQNSAKIALEKLKLGENK